MMETNKIYKGHVLDVLRTFPDKSIHCCITSPPYWGLRTYGEEAIQIWGENKHCDHVWEYEDKRIIEKCGNWQQAENGTGLVTGESQTRFRGDVRKAGKCDWNSLQIGVCEKCKAWKGQLGLEDTPELYVRHIIDVFREVRRVLRDDGTLWLNLDDSYIGGGRAGRGKNKLEHKNFGKRHLNSYDESIFPDPPKTPKGYKPKDLTGIPWEIALALRKDGWYLRQDIIWHKKAPKPESVKDRFTRAHEYMFLLSKNRKYYFDYEAIQRPIKKETKGRNRRKWDGVEYKNYPGGKQNNFKKWHETKAIKQTHRKERSVWSIGVGRRYKSNHHFATFSKESILRCVLAGCPPDGIVLDPFFGVGTTGVVAVENHRKFIGIEVVQRYCDEALYRLQSEVGLFL